MSGLQRTLLSTLCLLLVASPAVAQSRSTASALPSPRLLARHGLVMAWSNFATIDPTRDTVVDCTIDEEISLIQTSAGMVTAFDNQTGHRLWSRQLGRRDNPGHSACTNDTLALIISGLSLYAVDKYGGDIKWVLPIPSVPSTGPAVDEFQVYVGSLDGNLFAFDLQKSSALESEGLLPSRRFETVNWQHLVGTAITEPPVPAVIELRDSRSNVLVRQRVVNVAARDGSLYSYSSDRFRLRFQFESVTRAPISAPITQSGDFLYFPSEDFNFFCVNANTGQARWEFATAATVRQPARVMWGHVYLTTDRGEMLCLSAESGSEIWRNPHASEFLAASSEYIYASDLTGGVSIVSRHDGARVGSLPLRLLNYRVSNDSTDRIFLATSRGLIVCLHEIDRDLPLYHKHPERSPIMPGFAEEPGQEPEEEGEAAPSPAPAE